MDLYGHTWIPKFTYYEKSEGLLVRMTKWRRTRTRTVLLVVLLWMKMFCAEALSCFVSHLVSVSTFSLFFSACLMLPISLTFIKVTASNQSHLHQSHSIQSVSPSSKSQRPLHHAAGTAKASLGWVECCDHSHAGQRRTLCTSLCSASPTEGQNLYECFLTETEIGESA